MDNINSRKRKEGRKLLIISILIAVLMSVLNMQKVYAQDYIEEKRTINDISDEWQNIDDEQLNEIISNSDDNDLAIFLLSLSDEEFDKILARKTMLLNTITFYEPIDENVDEDDVEQVVESKQIYWEYLLSLANKPMALSTGTAITKTGYFFIVIEGNGVTTKRKVQITITNTNLSNQQTVKYSEVAVSGYSDNHNFTIISASAKTELAETYYGIFSFKFSYTKPAHYLAKGSYSDKCSGYRFNFSPYSQDNSLPTTVNNTGHNSKDTTEIIQMQINAMNAGIIKDDDEKTYHATGKLTLSLYYGGLKIDPNGGIWNNSIDVTSFTSKCTTTKNIENPTRIGYKFTGWTVSKGSNANGSINRNSKGSTINSDGCTFTYCGSSTSAPTDSSYFTTLKANWVESELEIPEAGSNSKLIIISLGIVCLICLKLLIKRRLKK